MHHFLHLILVPVQKTGPSGTGSGKAREILEISEIPEKLTFNMSRYKHNMVDNLVLPTLTHSYSLLLTHSLTYSLLLTHSYSLTHLLTFTYSLTHSLTHSQGSSDSPVHI